jgi:hypothetical protein
VRLISIQSAIGDEVDADLAVINVGVLAAATITGLFPASELLTLQPLTA